MMRSFGIVPGHCVRWLTTSSSRPSTAACAIWVNERSSSHPRNTPSCSTLLHSLAGGSIEKLEARLALRRLFRNRSWRGAGTVSEISEGRSRPRESTMTDTDKAQFTPPSSDGTVLKFQFFVLPPFQQGDICADVKASRSMELFYVPCGHHWVDGHPYLCPRIVSEGEEICPLCSGGFQSIKELRARKASKGKISAAARRWLPQTANLVNIFFPTVKPNPVELRGQVRYFRAPKACFDHWMECLERDDSRGEENPQACGFFFDEVEGYPYELRIGKSGNGNDYGTGGFIAADSAGRKSTRPVAAKRNGEPDMKAIQAILDQRHDLWLRQGTADIAQLENLVAKLLTELTALRRQRASTVVKAAVRSMPGRSFLLGHREAVSCN